MAPSQSAAVGGAPHMRKFLGILPADWACAGALLAVTLAMFAKGLADPAAIVHEDAASQFQPFYQFVADEVKAGRFPHWCPYVSCGVPFHSTLHGAVLYPFRWPLFWMDYCQGYVASLIVHFFLGALFTYLFLRKVPRCSPPASLIGAISFGFGGFAFGHVTHWNYFQAYPWFVLTILLFARALARPRWARAVAASLPVALIGLAGAVHILLILGLGLCLWGAGESAARAFRRIRTKQGTLAEITWPVLVVAVVCALGGLIAMAQLGPAQLQSELSTRGGPAMPDAQRWKFITEMCVDPLPTAERMVVPFLYGNYRLGYWGANNYHETTFYAGIIPLVAAAIGLGAWRTNRWVPRLAMFAVVMFVLSAGRFLPVFRLLYDFVPGFDRLRDPARIFVWVQFSIACLAAIGIDRGLGGTGPSGLCHQRPQVGNPGHLRLVAAVAGGLAIVSLAGGMAAIATVRSADSWGRQFIRETDRADDAAQQGRAAALEEMARKRKERAAALEEMGRKVIDEKDPLAWAGAAVGAASALAAAAFFALGRCRRRWFAGVLAALLALDLGLASTGMLHWSNRMSALNRVPDQVRFLQDRLGTQRYAALQGAADEEAGLNRCMQFRIAGVRSIDPGIFFTPRQQVLLDKTAASRRVADLVGARYLVTDGELHEANVSPVYRKGNVLIYQNEEAFPLAFLARRVEVAADPNSIVAAMIRGPSEGYVPVPLLDVALVEEEVPPLPPPKPDEPAGTVADLRTVPGEYLMRTEAAGDRQLVLTVTYHPEWRCEVDGRETPIYETDLGFMSARVPAGAHGVRWWFDPEWFHLGLAGTIAGLVIAVCVLVAQVSNLWPRGRCRGLETRATFAAVGRRATPPRTARAPR